jgi:hypothetical protein
MIKADNLQLIGEFRVASGQAIVGDPCYLEDWIPWDQETVAWDEKDNKGGEYGYLGACNATLKKGFGELGNQEECDLCEGKGIRTDENGVKIGMDKKKLSTKQSQKLGRSIGFCNGCEGVGKNDHHKAVAFSTGYGDGLYPVYANINEDGRVGLIVIDFTGEYFTEEN